jgi:hypothetical protein
MRIVAILVGVLALPTAALAQRTDYSAGKTAAQLFSGNCTACHKTPRGLAKERDARALTAFLREHYTSNNESAVALTGYLLGNPAPPSEARKKPEPAERNQENRETRGQDRDSNDIVVPEGGPPPRASREAAKKPPRSKGKKPTAAELAREAAKAAEEQKARIADYANAGEEAKPLEPASAAPPAAATTAPSKPAQPEAEPSREAAPAAQSSQTDNAAEKPATPAEHAAPAAEDKPPADEKPAASPPG